LTNEVGQLKKVITLQKKLVSFFQEKIGLTPSVAAPGDTSTLVTPLHKKDIIASDGTIQPQEKTIDTI